MSQLPADSTNIAPYGQYSGAYNVMGRNHALAHHDQWRRLWRHRADMVILTLKARTWQVDLKWQCCRARVSKYKFQMAKYDQDDCERIWLTDGGMFPPLGFWFARRVHGIPRGFISRVIGLLMPTLSRWKQLYVTVCIGSYGLVLLGRNNSVQSQCRHSIDSWRQLWIMLA